VLFNEVISEICDQTLVIVQRGGACKSRRRNSWSEANHSPR